MDLFKHAEERAKRYPEVPGSKGLPTSALAAREVESKAALLRERVQRVYATCENPDGLNPDEVADILGEDVLSIRPRCSELLKCEPPYLEVSHITRPSSRGKPSMCLRRKRP